MTTDGGDLDDRLDALRSDAENVQQQLKVSTAGERRFYAAAYFWWREARNQPDYLPQAFAAAGIKHNATRNRINWRPLLRLVNKDISKTDADIWSKAFTRIDEEVSAYPAQYKHDPIGQLDYFIKANGGKTGLAGYHDKQDDDELDDSKEDEETALKSFLFDLDDEDFRPAFLKLAKPYYSTSHPIAKAAPSTAKIEVGEFGLAVIRPDVAAPAIVASTAVTKLVEQVLVEAYRDDFIAASPSVRAIVETIHIANIPHVVSRSSERFIEYTKAQLDGGPKQTVKAAKRLVYRASTNDLLLSQVHVPSSVCVIAKPKRELISEASTDVLLPPYVRRSIEAKLLHQRLLNVFQPAFDGVFTATPHSSITHSTLPLRMKPEMADHIEAAGISERQAKKHIRNFSHPTLAFVPFYESPTVAQCDVKPNTPNPTWSLQADYRWLQGAVAAFFDNWIAEYGIKANRPMNKVLGVSLNPSEMIICYEFGKEQDFSNVKVLPLAPHTATGTAHLVIRSVDFAFVLKQIASLPLVGTISFAANNDLFSVECETDVNSYKVYIPACDDAGTRFSHSFSNYTPTAVAASPFAEYEQDAEGE
jgi:hypothetical protein